MGASGSFNFEIEGSALKGRRAVAVRLRSGFCFSSISETVSGLGGCGALGAFAGSASAVLLLAPEAAEDVDRAVVFFAAEVVTAGFGEEERGVLVAIQIDVRGSEKREVLRKEEGKKLCPGASGDGELGRGINLLGSGQITAHNVADVLRVA